MSTTLVEFMCQCPIAGLPHFYAIIVSKVLDKKHTVSMPYSGLTSFLLITMFGNNGLVWILCQCPIAGLPHFYHILMEEIILIIVSVNAL